MGFRKNKYEFEEIGQKTPIKAPKDEFCKLTGVQNFNYIFYKSMRQA